MAMGAGRLGPDAIGWARSRAHTSRSTPLGLGWGGLGPGRFSRALGGPMHPFVLRVAGMPIDMQPGDPVLGGRGAEPGDEVIVRPGPAAGGHGDDVGGVGVEPDLAGLLEGEQAFEGGVQFHTVIGGPGHGSREQPLVARAPGVDIDNQGRPPAGARIALTSALIGTGSLGQRVAFRFCMFIPFTGIKR